MFKLKSGIIISIIFAVSVNCSNSSNPSTSIDNSPVISNIPNQVIIEGTEFSNFNLNNYVSDADNNDSDLIWTYENNIDLVVQISNNVVTISVPSPEWIGIENITFRATDPDGNWDEYQVTFEVIRPPYAPLNMTDLQNSTPLAQGVDPTIIYEIYQKADTLSIFNNHLYSLLVLKNGYLIAEQYFNEKTVNHATASASVTKSYISALTGLALQDGFLSSIDQKMVDFFPEFNWSIMDPRKSDVTIRQILKMRSGYPWEEQFPQYLDDLFNAHGNFIPLLIEFPLIHDPGAEFGYSNLTAHTMAVILARATGDRLSVFAQQYLFTLLGYQLSRWPTDASGNNVGMGDMEIKPRDMAKFGLLFLNEGKYNGIEVLLRSWVLQSLQPYSFNVYPSGLINHFGSIDYGYMWWITNIHGHRVNYAWGHGGQTILMVPDFNLIVITTADNLLGDFTPQGWQKEKAVLDIVGELVYNISNQ